jgi:hypothetical protein
MIITRAIINRRPATALTTATGTVQFVEGDDCKIETTAFAVQKSLS